MSNPNGVTADQLRAFIERIERMEKEKKAISDEIKLVYAEAKIDGYDVKVMRQLVRLRKLDDNERQEMEAMLGLYQHALGMEPTDGPVKSPSSNIEEPCNLVSGEDGSKTEPASGIIEVPRFPAAIAAKIDPFPDHLAILSNDNAKWLGTGLLKRLPHLDAATKKLLNIDWSVPMSPRRRQHLQETSSFFRCQLISARTRPPKRGELIVTIRPNTSDASKALFGENGVAKDSSGRSMVSDPRSITRAERRSIRQTRAIGFRWTAWMTSGLRFPAVGS